MLVFVRRHGADGMHLSEVSRRPAAAASAHHPPPRHRHHNLRAAGPHPSMAGVMCYSTVSCVASVARKQAFPDLQLKIKPPSAAPPVHVSDQVVFYFLFLAAVKLA